MSESITATGIIQTYTGRYIDVLNPRPEDINIQDIAHQLSMICRFNGACSSFYSVAEHCYIASNFVPDHLRAAALLHDAAEAYIGDLITPLKNVLPEFRSIEDGLQKAIHQRFNIVLSAEDKKELKKIDLIMLATERRDLMPQDGSKWEILRGVPCLPYPLYKLSPNNAKAVFLSWAEKWGVN